jgi:hypothetical protein
VQQQRLLLVTHISYVAHISSLYLMLLMLLQIKAGACACVQQQ